MGRGLRQSITQINDLDPDFAEFLQKKNVRITSITDLIKISQEYKRQKGA